MNSICFSKFLFFFGILICLELHFQTRFPQLTYERAILCQGAECCPDLSGRVTQVRSGEKKQARQPERQQTNICDCFRIGIIGMSWNLEKTVFK